MATFTVSSSAGLKSALGSARGGDTILLKGGDYGRVDLNGKQMPDLKFSSNVTIASAEAKNPAVLDRLTMVHTSNITFKGIEFDYSGASGTSKPFNISKSSNITIRDSTFDGVLSKGYGSGQGIWLTDMKNVTLEGNSFTNFWTAAHFRSIEGLKVLDNSFKGSALDAMIFGRVQNVLIEGNQVNHKAIPNVEHKDAIQFWNTGENAPSKNIVIRNNDLRTDDGMTHGIFFGNLVATQTGRKDAYFSNVLIEDNTIVTGQTIGIAVAHTLGLTIRDNVVLQNPARETDRATYIPVIRVHEDAEQVSITGNVTHRTPEAAGANWQPTGTKEAGWKIADNKIVALGSSVAAPKAIAVDAPSAPEAEPEPAAPIGPKPPTSSLGNNDADTFRFDGYKKGGTVSADFGEGDRIVLINYDKDTFSHLRGGNDLRVSLDGTYTVLDTIADAAELDKASAEVSLRKSGDALVLRIAQDWGTQEVALKGYADAFLI